MMWSAFSRSARSSISAAAAVRRPTSRVDVSARRFQSRRFQSRRFQSRRFQSRRFQSRQSEADRLIIVGSGVAGCSAALVAAEQGLSVTLLTAGSSIVDNNSYWAQGGIIYRNYDPQSGDSASSLADDIHVAGAGLCQDDAVQKLAAEGPGRVRQLLLDESGTYARVPFDRDPRTDELLLCLEASHSAPRILYHADKSGAAITEHITAAANRHPNVQVVTESIVTDLCMVDDKVCAGVKRMNRNTGEIQPMLANRGVVLAAGGLASIYQHTTNPAGFNALGSSVALSLRAGASAADLEYVQFHPTALYIPNEARFLLTEALRGEGALLRDADGRAFAQNFHPKGELAPRDVVARGVFRAARESPGGHVYLDVSHRDPDFLTRRFPTVHGHLMQRGIDMRKEGMPVVPAAHYTCGGVASDLQGRTDVTNLYVAGEAARTGLHGGNRLASTSLLEGLVFGASVADFVASEEGREVAASVEKMVMTVPPPGEVVPARTSEAAAEAAAKLLADLRATMWDKVGVERTVAGTAEAVARLGEMREEATRLFEVSPAVATAAVRDAACAGEAVARAAHHNRTSAGGHYMVDAVSEAEEKEELLAMASSA